MCGRDVGADTALSADMAAIMEWLQEQVAPLLARGETCTVTLHIGQGDIRAHMERKYLIRPPRRYKPVVR